MSENQFEPVLIGRYQLENLQKNRVGFLFLDVSERPSSHDLLAGRQSVQASDALAFLAAQGVKPDAPIVLICETGAISVGVAKVFEQNSFINVFVIDGGLEGLKSNDS